MGHRARITAPIQVRRLSRHPTTAPNRAQARGNLYVRGNEPIQKKANVVLEVRASRTVLGGGNQYDHLHEHRRAVSMRSSGGPPSRTTISAANGQAPFNLPVCSAGNHYQQPRLRFSRAATGGVQHHERFPCRSRQPTTAQNALDAPHHPTPK